MKIKANANGTSLGMSDKAKIDRRYLFARHRAAVYAFALEFEVRRAVSFYLNDRRRNNNVFADVYIKQKNVALAEQVAAQRDLNFEKPAHYQRNGERDNKSAYHRGGEYYARRAVYKVRDHHCYADTADVPQQIFYCFHAALLILSELPRWKPPAP